MLPAWNAQANVTRSIATSGSYVVPLFWASGLQAEAPLSLIQVLNWMKQTVTQNLDNVVKYLV